MDAIVSEKIDSFFKSYPVKSYKKGQILIYSGDNPPGIFHLLSGRVRQYDIASNGDEIVVNTFKPPAFFPITWAINRTPNEYFYETSTEASLRVAPVDATVKFLKKNPDVIYDYLSSLSIGVDEMLRRMTYLMKGSAHARTVLELLNSSKHFGTKYKNGSMIVITENELAAQAGLTRETISRELHKLQTNGLITINNNHVIIKNLSELEEELNHAV